MFTMPSSSDVVFFASTVGWVVWLLLDSALSKRPVASVPPVPFARPILCAEQWIVVPAGVLAHAALGDCECV